MLAFIGLLGFWEIFFYNLIELKKKEVELLDILEGREEKGIERSYQPSLTDMKLYWFKYGAMASYFLSIIAVIYYGMKYIFKFLLSD
jgi:hypothetical protein